MDPSKLAGSIRRLPVRRGAHRNWVDTCIAGTTCLVYVFLLMPIAVVVVFSFTKSSTGYLWTGFTASWYSRLLHEEQLLHALKVSVIVGSSATLISVLLGLMGALALGRYRFRGRSAVVGLIIVPLVIPELVLATSLLVLFTRSSIPLGYISLIIGHVVITLPYTTLIQFAGVSRLKKSVEEAAADLGASAVSVVLRIVIPQMLPVMVAAFIFGFLVSFDDIVMSTFLSGVGTTMMPVYIYSMLKLGVSPVVNALGTILVGITIALMMSSAMRQATVQTREGG